MSLLCLVTLQLCRAQTIQITGTPSPGLAAFDSAVTAIMAKYGVPGAALAVTRNGSLVLAHGYGANVQPDSVFRIASLSKQLTAVAILKLAQEGKLSLDAKVADLLPSYFRNTALGVPDVRFEQITVRMLLEHAGGWDSSVSFDVNTRQLEAAAALNAPSPASSADMIRYMMRFPLDFDPGSRYAYSNLGYLILGRIVEAVAGGTYEQYVRNQLLAPLGIFRMRIGQSLQIGTVPDEVAYYPSPDLGNTRTVFPFGPAQVPWQYGGEYREAYDSNGGWTASAIDLAKFWNGIDGRRGTALLNTASIAQVTARPPLAQYQGASYWYGLGFLVRPVGSDANLWHDGGLIGTRTYAVRYASGQFSTGNFNYVILFNEWPDHANPNNPFLQEVDAVMTSTFGQISTWPLIDLFPSYANGDLVHPFINGQDGVLHGLSYQRGIIPGSWFSIFGTDLAPDSRTWTSADFGANGQLPLSLDGVTVKVNDRQMALSHISPGQVDALVPQGLTNGAVTVQVIRDTVASAPVVTEIRSFRTPTLFWQNNASRDVTVWFMGGPQGSIQLSQNWVGATPGWTLRAAADMNGDGIPDLLWQNDVTRDVTVWFMGGPQGSIQLSQNWVGATPGWTLRAAADMNGDGVPDLLWQNDVTRDVTVWFMGGPQGSIQLSQNWVGATPGWTLHAAADMNGDGIPDLLWQNDVTRDVTVWFMGGPQGSIQLSQNWVGATPGWTLRTAADMNGDGVPDLLWQNDVTRDVTVWFMGGPQGSIQLSQNWVGATPGWTLNAAK